MSEFRPIENFSKYLACDEGYVLNTKTGYKIYGYQKKNGYCDISIKNDSGETKTLLIHRIIAEAFCEKPCSDDIEVNHINGDKNDNRAVNLEWVTHNRNLKHAYENGLRIDDVSAKSVVGTNMETGEQIVFSSIYKAARFLNASQGNICMCCKGLRPYANGYYWEYV